MPAAPADTDLTTEIPALAASAAALAAHPAPALALSRGGAVRGANAAGRALGQLLESGRKPVLQRALARLAATVLGTEEALVERVEVASGGGKKWLEVAVLPDGRDQVVALLRDATLDTNMRLALVDSRQRYRDLVEISSDFAWETGADGAFVFVSPQGALGYPADELVGMRPRSLLVGGEAGDSVVFEARERCHQVQIWVRDAAGREACLLASAKPVFDQTGTWCGARGLCHDVTAERLRDAELARARNREQVVAYIVRQIREEVRPAAMLDAAATALGRATSTAAGVFRTGQEAALVLAARHGDWFDEQHSVAVAAALAGVEERLDGSVGGCRVLARPTSYRGAANGAVAIVRDGDGTAWSDDDGALLDAVAAPLGIALRQIADQRELERLSRTDGLTGLLNRRACEEELERALDRARREQQPGVVLYIDLDNFKPINDRYGHQRGDALLCAVADLLREGCRAYDLAARLGGDEFALWLSGVDAVGACQRASELLARLGELADRAPCEDAPLGMSIGIAGFEPACDEPAEALVLRADAALYQAKHAGKNRYAVAPAAARTGSDKTPALTR